MDTCEVHICGVQNLQRALREDLNQKIRYEVSYIRNKKAKVIIDRRYNVRSLMNLYMGRNAISDDRINWDPDDPNKLTIFLPGLYIFTPYSVEQVGHADLDWTSSLQLIRLDSRLKCCDPIVKSRTQ